MCKRNTKKHYILIAMIFLLSVTMLFNILGCSAGNLKSKVLYSSDIMNNTASLKEIKSLGLTDLSDDFDISKDQNEENTDVLVSTLKNNQISSLCVSDPNMDSKMENSTESMLNSVLDETDNENIEYDFNKNTIEFSIELFKKIYVKGENSLVSPLSTLLALSMTANGADNETLSQMEKVLCGGASIDELNKRLYSYVNGLANEEKSKLKIANSIWLNNNNNMFKINDGFLQKNADYYNTAVFNSPFNSKTVKDINDWVKNNTDGMINSIINQIDTKDIMYLINTIIFDAEWDNVYQEGQISQGEFTAFDGTKQTAYYMNSTESIYLNDGKATGFIKPYANNKYSFVALLPNEGISIDDYLSSLTAEGFINIIKGVDNIGVNAKLPKFNCDSNIGMNDALYALGMTDAFSVNNADFNKLGDSVTGNIYIDKVFQKSFISVDNFGTKAGAATSVIVGNTSIHFTEIKTVKLDRPFVYAIVDNTDNLPIFMGTMMSLQN